MSTLTRPMTYLDLEDPAQCPDDGRRYEVISGELYAAAAPDRRHQDLSALLTVRLYRAANETGLGRVYAAPVDVRLLGTDQVQPDLIVILRERLHIYRGHVIFGPPDLVIEILSPSTRNVDEGHKRRFYAEAGVPEYWLFDPDGIIRPFALVDGAYVSIEPEVDGSLRSRVLPTFVVVPAETFAVLDEFEIE
jgi:Uma2 family endonuclease